MQAKQLHIDNNAPAQRLSFQAGPYEVRLAETRRDIEEAQALRFRIFYQENHGSPTEEMVAA